MNQFSTTDSNAGLLKVYYPQGGEPTDTLAEALKRKRQKLMETRGLETSEEGGSYGGPE